MRWLRSAYWWMRVWWYAQRWRFTEWRDGLRRRADQQETYDYGRRVEARLAARREKEDADVDS